MPQSPVPRVQFLLHNLVRALARTIIAIVFIGLLVWNVFLVYLLTTKLQMNDFGRFYYSAMMFWQGKDMYEVPPGGLLQTFDLRPGGNMNPPHLHVLILPLALLSPGKALFLWGVGNLLCLFKSLRIIVNEAALRPTLWQYGGGALGLLGFSATAMVLVTGQLSLLLLLPVMLAWAAARKRKWSTAAGYLGVTMSVKPFLLIFLPYFLLRRRWRAAMIAIGVVVLCFTLGGIVFGIDAHVAWVRTLAAVDWEWNNMNASILGFLKRTLSETPNFSPLVSAPDFIPPLWIALTGVTGVLTILASLPDGHESDVDRAFALLLLAALLISPLGWAYYLWLPVGPLIALVSRWWKVDEAGPSSIPAIIRWRNFLLLAAVPGLVWPFFDNILFPHHPWATVSLGSLYFWSTFCLWAALIVDWWAFRDTCNETYGMLVKKV